MLNTDFSLISFSFYFLLTDLVELCKFLRWLYIYVLSEWRSAFKLFSSFAELQECNQKLDDELKKERRDHDNLQKEIAKLEKAQGQMKEEVWLIFLRLTE